MEEKMIDPKIVKEHGLTEEEYDRIIKILGRHPNINELGMYSVLWSEHCSYKNSKPLLKKFPTTGKYVLQGPGENAGIVDIGDGLAVVFKMESHNHPSAVEPYQGAATGVGGIIRDIFTMGARPIAGLNSLRFGPITNNKKNRFLLSGVVAGIAGYGNCIGIPTVAGEVFFDESYTGNCLVNAMCVGIVQSGEKEVDDLYGPIIKGYAAGVDNPIFYVGASTGRDGIHGATFASVELSEESEEKRSSVQVGDPFQEKLLVEACLELLKKDCVVGMQDMGAAGLTSSLSEMASRADNGVEIDIALVPAREAKMTPYEFLLSESQERMVIILKKGKEEEAYKIFEKWGLHSVVIGKVTNDKMFRVLENGKVVAEVPARSLADDAPVYKRESIRPGYLDQVQQLDLDTIPDVNYNKAASVFQRLLTSPNIASKRWVYEQYDHMVQTNTIALPGAADAAVLRIKGSDKKLSVSTDCNARYCYLDPYTGGQIALAEAARNVSCTGAEPMAITDCLNFANPEKPEMFWQLEQCVTGLADACKKFNVPVISGNVSLYNENEGCAIFPTPSVGIVGLINKDLGYCSMEWKNEGDHIYLLGENKDEIGGSEYLKVIYDKTAGLPPAINLEYEMKLQQITRKIINENIVNSAHDCSEGGLLITLAEGAITGNKGANIELSRKGLRLDSLLFGETQSRIVVTVPEKNVESFKCATERISSKYIGKVMGTDFVVKVDNKEIINNKVKDMAEAYYEAIPRIMNQ